MAAPQCRARDLQPARRRAVGRTRQQRTARDRSASRSRPAPGPGHAHPATARDRDTAAAGGKHSRPTHNQHLTGTARGDRAREQALQLRAADWFEAAGDTQRAAHHLLAARQADRALALPQDRIMTDLLRDPTLPAAPNKLSVLINSRELKTQP
jgi:hypothetical protein